MPADTRKSTRPSTMILIRLIVIAIFIISLPLSCIHKRSHPFGIILVVLDAARADHFSLYGYPGKTTPHIDQLARDSLVYQRAYTVADYTWGSIYSLLSGKYASFYRNIDPGLREWPFMLPKLLAQKNISVGLFSSSILQHKYGFYVPFEHAYTREPFKATDPFDIVRHASQWILQQHRPYFAYVHIIQPHDPYIPPLRYAPPVPGGRPPRFFSTIWRYERLPESIAATGQKGLKYWYDANLRWADDAVGYFIRSLKQKGVLTNSWLIITADHGEELGDNGGYFHLHDVFEPLIRIPLIIRPPDRLNVRPGKRKMLVLMQDLYSTILELFRMKIPFHTPFRSLIPSFRNPTALVRPYLVSCTAQMKSCAFIQGRTKTIMRVLNNRFWPLPDKISIELYRLPDENVLEDNRAIFEPDRALTLGGMLYQWWVSQDWKTLEGTTTYQSNEIIEQLQALGYIDTGSRRLHVRFTPAWLPLEKIRADLKPEGFSIEFEPTRPVLIARITNRSPFVWPSLNWQDKGQLLFSVTFSNSNGKDLHLVSPLPYDLFPQQSRLVPIQFPNGVTPGPWKIKIDLGQKGRTQKVTLGEFQVVVPRVFSRIGNGWWRVDRQTLALKNKAYWFFYFPENRRPCMTFEIPVKAYGQKVSWTISTHDGTPLWKGTSDGNRWQTIRFSVPEDKRSPWIILFIQTHSGEKIAAEVKEAIPPDARPYSILTLQLRRPRLMTCSGQKLPLKSRYTWQKPEETAS